LLFAVGHSLHADGTITGVSVDHACAQARLNVSYSDLVPGVSLQVDEKALTLEGEFTHGTNGNALTFNQDCVLSHDLHPARIGAGECVTAELEFAHVTA
jgi:hypothetical protein